MAARIASLVCCLGLITGVHVAAAQTTSNASSAPTTATPGPNPSAPSAAGTSNVTETDERGRSLWFPSAQRGASQESAASKPLLPFQQGFLLLPYLGLSIPLGDDSGSYTVGHNFGALIGVHLGPNFSLNTEINVDYMSPGPLATETQIDYALTPLLQSGGTRHVWVLGMKLGMYSLTRSDAGTETYSSSATTNYSTTGFVWGFTFGGFVPLGPMAVGCLTRLSIRKHSSNCEEGSRGTLCNEGEKNGVSPVFTTFDFSIGALF